MEGRGRIVLLWKMEEEQDVWFEWTRALCECQLGAINLNFSGSFSGSRMPVRLLRPNSGECNSQGSHSSHPAAATTQHRHRIVPLSIWESQNTFSTNRHTFNGTVFFFTYDYDHAIHPIDSSIDIALCPAQHSLSPVHAPLSLVFFLSLSHCTHYFVSLDYQLQLAQ